MAKGIGLADGDRQEGIEAEPVMVIEIFIAQAEAEDPLFAEIEERMFDECRIAMIGEALGETFEEVKLGVDVTQEQGAAVRNSALTRRLSTGNLPEPVDATVLCVVLQRICRLPTI